MRDPRGVVVCEEARDGSVDFVEVVLAMDGVWEEEVMLVERVLLVVAGDIGGGEELREELRGESMWRPARLDSGVGFGAVIRVTIFMPLLVLVLAGMKSVVCLSAAGTAIRLGWLALHPIVVSCVPVE